MVTQSALDLRKDVSHIHVDEGVCGGDQACCVCWYVGADSPQWDIICQYCTVERWIKGPDIYVSRIFQ